MKSAIQSFKETRMYYENKSNQELAKIFTEIDESINDGLFSVAGIGSLSDNALFVLRELGYDAQNDTFRESNYYWINWMTIDACTKKLDEKILKICRENDEQITQIKRELKKQKRSRIIYSFIGGFIGYYIGKFIFYLLAILL